MNTECYYTQVGKYLYSSVQDKLVGTVSMNSKSGTLRSDCSSSQGMMEDIGLMNSIWGKLQGIQRLDSSVVDMLGSMLWRSLLDMLILMMVELKIEHKINVYFFSPLNLT